MTGLNKVGYTMSSEVEFSSRTSAGGYSHGYVLTIPTAVAVVGAVYLGYLMIAGGVGYAGVAVAA